jgi:hypothetical protein
MVTKKKPGLPPGGAERAAVVTEGAVQAALRRAPARELAPEEEKVMRMRLGASPPRTAPLERVAAGDADLEIETRALEIELYLRWKAREEERGARAATARTPAPVPSRAKEKIIRALRKKG